MVAPSCIISNNPWEFTVSWMGQGWTCLSHS